MPGTLPRIRVASGDNVNGPRPAQAAPARIRNKRLHNARRGGSVFRNQTLQEAVMELGTIEREVFVEAAPEVVFEVVSRPEHLRQWWPDDAQFEPTPGASGEIVFGDPSAGGAVVALTVLESLPPRTFSFRWT